MSEQERERQAKLQLLTEKLKKQGLAGQKLGKHKVPKSNVIVQLGEDLTESLRGLKVCTRYHPIRSCKLIYHPQLEGNLFRDRFQSLQQRALIEPRVPVVYVLFFHLFSTTHNFCSPKRRKHRMIEYEKHAWKNFDRE
jgi:nucleolar protein 53